MSRQRHHIYLFSVILLLVANACHFELPEEPNESGVPCTVHEVTSHQSQPIGALMSTRISDLNELQEMVDFEYVTNAETDLATVKITHCSGNKQVVSILSEGISEGDMKDAARGGLLDKAELMYCAPYLLSIRYDLFRVFMLASRKYEDFCARDVAFYDLALSSVRNIDSLTLASINPRDTGEKGFINTFNHITAQAFVTTVFSEELANFIADSHERLHMPELITGVFTDSMLIHPHNNPLDNYVDIINNEWGQEIGKDLKQKYGITKNTVWTPTLLTSYLNDLQAYYTWSMKIGMRPFRETDEVIVKFCKKLNRVMSDEDFEI